MKYVISHKRDAGEFAVTGLGERIVFANKKAAARMKDMYPAFDGFEIESVESHNKRLADINYAWLITTFTRGYNMPIRLWLENIVRMMHCDLLHRDVRFAHCNYKTVVCCV